MFRRFPRDPRVVASALWIALGAASFGRTPAQAAGHTPVETLARIRSHVAPLYPDSLRRAGVEGTVVVRLRLTETGAVCDARPLSGPPALYDAAVATARRWTFDPYRADGEPESTWVQIPIAFSVQGSPTTNGSTPATAVVRVPLIQPTDAIDESGPPFLGLLQFRIGADGFVKESRFLGPAPPNAATVLARAQRWWWQPATDSSGNAVAALNTIRVPARAGALVIARPDSALGAVLGQASVASVSVEDSSGVLRRRAVDPIVFAHVLGEWLSDPKAFGGPDPWRTNRAPHFDAHVAFDGQAGVLRIDIDRGGDWMLITTANRFLPVAYRAIHARVESDLAKIMFVEAPTGSARATR
jgi:TonB family protein